MHRKLTSTWDEDALSEVVGFVLIIAVLIGALSLYLTYGVPVQGRDNEIRHMDEIKDEFVGYKIGIDSLWTNSQVDSVLSTTIKMGTSGPTSQGGGFLQFAQPVPSSGMVTINQRTSSHEVLKITSYSYVKNRSFLTTVGPTTITTTPTLQTYENPPDMLNITITAITGIGESANSHRAIFVNGTDTSGIHWQAWVNITPRSTYYRYYTYTFTPPDTLTPMLNEGYQYNRTDLTLTVIKNNTRTLSDFTLYSNIQTTGTPYIIDLMNPTYGLTTNIQKTPSVWYSRYDPDDQVTALALAQNSYILQPQYIYSVPLGSVEYRANNYYWIPQTYYYQLGGVFLSQTDGTVPKVSPSLSFVYNKSNPGPIRVNIDAIAFDQGNSLAISGATPLQIATKVKSDSGTLPYAEIPANTMNMSINITSPSGDSATLQMWKQYFEDAANKTGGIPNNLDLYSVGNTTTDAYIFIKGAYDPSKSAATAGTSDINLDVRAINLTASLQGMGGS